MLESLQHGGEKELKTYIYRKMWYPDYRYLFEQRLLRSNLFYKFIPKAIRLQTLMMRYHSA